MTLTPKSRSSLDWAAARGSRAEAKMVQVRMLKCVDVENAGRE
jgi:hypothetical protein